MYVNQILRTSRGRGRAEPRGRAAALRPPPTSCAHELESLNDDDAVAGIIVQQPLPRHIPLSTVTDTILPAKDIDGIHPLNTGLMTLGFEGFLPACAEAAVEILKLTATTWRASALSSSGAATWSASPSSCCSSASTAR